MKRLKYFTLAALVAFAACGEDEPPPEVVVITGTISGVVTIEGVGQSGVSVALSSGASATTDGSGSYSFANVEAGAYTVTISGFASDATFSATAKAASITTAGQVVQVNFDGAYVRTSAILGAVSAGGSGLQGVNVSIGSASTQTDANGQYSFSGLRAGTYTVSISGFNASTYIFSATSQTVTLGVGESEVVSFSGQLATTARIAGQLFVDEAPKNDFFDSSEDALAAAGVGITLEISPGNTRTTETAADGSYEFADLEAGTYKVSIASTDTDIPAAYKFGGQVDIVETVSVGQSKAVNWPFDIETQTLKVGAFLGRDDPKAGPSGVAPVKGIIINLYSDQAKTNDLGRDTTGADGYATFSYKREKDTSPQGGADNIVFAEIAGAGCTGALCAHLEINGEGDVTLPQLEISYLASQAVATAPDVFDYTYNEVVIRFSGQEIDGEVLDTTNATKFWDVWTFKNDTTPAGAIPSGNMTSKSVAHVTLSAFANATNVDTLYFQLNPTAAAANTHVFSQTGVAGDMGGAVSRFLHYVWDGTVLPADTIHLGYLDVKYHDSDVVVRAHHEADDTLGLTKGDNFDGNGLITVSLQEVDSTVVNSALKCGGLCSFPFPGDPGLVTFFHVEVDSAFAIQADTVKANRQHLLGQDRWDFTLDGSDQVVRLYTKESSYAHKFHNTKIQGHVWASDEATTADSVQVTVTAADNNLGSTWSRTLTVGRAAYGAGNFATPDSLLEGPYVVTVADLAGKWAFFDTDTLEVGGTSSTGGAAGNVSGSADNKDERTAIRDAQGSANVQDAHFMATRTDGKIMGTVANDRDYDGNTIDPGEALEGAQLGLYTDYGSATKQVLHETATSGVNGGYSFSNVVEYNGVAYDDRAAFKYTVAWITDTPSNATVVLRSLTSTSVDVNVTAAAPTVGTMTPTTLPAWDYNLTEGLGATLNPAHFAFLVKNTTVRGTIQDGAAKAVSGMTVSLRRCNDSVGAVGSVTPNPARDYGVDGLPGGGDDVVSCNDGAVDYLGTTQNTTTNASGVFEFGGLTEGVYEVIPQPTTVGTFTTSTPAARLYFTLGSGDIESATFTVS